MTDTILLFGPMGGGTVRSSQTIPSPGGSGWAATAAPPGERATTASGLVGLDNGRTQR